MPGGWVGGCVCTSAEHSDEQPESELVCCICVFALVTSHLVCVGPHLPICAPPLHAPWDMFVILRASFHFTLPFAPGFAHVCLNVCSIHLAGTWKGICKRVDK